MLKHEFEELTNRKLTNEEYIEVEAMYMNAGDISKEYFARLWLQTGKNPLTRMLAEQAEYHRQRSAKLEQRVKETNEKITEVAHELLQEWGEHQTRHSHDLAVKLIGHMAAMKYMVVQKMPLTADDYELIESCVRNMIE